MPRANAQVNGKQKQALEVDFSGNRTKRRPPHQPMMEEDLESDYSQDYESLDNESGVAGLNHILTKLGSQFQERIRIKKRKLDEDFKDVKAGLEKVLEIHQLSEDRRHKETLELKRESSTMVERLRIIVQLQEANEDKHTKMISSLTKTSEQNKKLVEDCIKIQADTFQKFMTELGKLEEKQTKAAEALIRQCEGVLDQIKGKVIKESVKAETENLLSTQFL